MKSILRNIAFMISCAGWVAAIVNPALYGIGMIVGLVFLCLMISLY